MESISYLKTKRNNLYSPDQTQERGSNRQGNGLKLVTL